MKWRMVRSRRIQVRKAHLRMRLIEYDEKAEKAINEWRKMVRREVANVR
jgi:hypothetical protein